MHRRMDRLLKPVAVFCAQTKSQQYIKHVHNLGDAWDSLTEERGNSDMRSTIVETAFGLTMRIQDGLEEQPSIFMDLSAATQSHENDPIAESHLLRQSLRHFRIFADYGTEFIWLNDHDPFYSLGSSSIGAPDALESFPASVLENYNAWVADYTDNFHIRLMGTGNFNAEVFPTATEKVAWQVAGYLLAWRIVLSPAVGSVEYSVDRSKYVLSKGNERDLTLVFLSDCAALLADARSSAEHRRI